MDNFKDRQLTQMRFAIADFRESKISLSVLLSRLEGAARTFSQGFWEQDVFTTALELEQINVDVVEERRGLTDSERMQVEALIAKLETRLSKSD